VKISAEELSHEIADKKEGDEGRARARGRMRDPHILQR
jgi:hypothetical protein